LEDRSVVGEIDDLIHQGLQLLREARHVDAFTVFEAASDQGSSYARYMTALMYDSGLGTEADKDKALALYLSAAELGDADAQAKVGGLYIFGGLVDIDHEKAAYWFEKAASQGNTTAINDLR
jgi:TPR repeat protein